MQRRIKIFGRIDYQGIREDLLAMIDRAETEYEKGRTAILWGLPQGGERLKRERHMEQLEVFRSACLDEISRLRREGKIAR